MSDSNLLGYVVVFRNNWASGPHCEAARMVYGASGQAFANVRERSQYRDGVADDSDDLEFVVAELRKIDHADPR